MGENKITKVQTANDGIFGVRMREGTQSKSESTNAGQKNKRHEPHYCSIVCVFTNQDMIVT